MKQDNEPQDSNARVSLLARFLKNVAVNLQATGAAAVLIAWLLAVVVITLWAEPTQARYAFGLLGFFGGALFVILGQRIR